MHEQLDLLLDLSAIDADLSELLMEYQSLPGRIAELEHRKKAIREGIAAREAALEDSAAERRRLERGLEDLTAKLADLESKRLLIKTNEEYAALSLEIEHARTHISETEDQILRGLEIAEEGTSALEIARSEAESEERAIDADMAELGSELSRLDDAVAVKKDERLRLSKRVRSDILRRYERILESKGDCAVCRVSNGACSACRMRLPPQTVIEIKRSDAVMECQSCGRLLCWGREGDVG